MVFCGNCKWFHSVFGHFGPGPIECRHPLNTVGSEVRYDYERRWNTDRITLKEPKDLNKDNKCEWYERKWWKWWVK